MAPKSLVCDPATRFLSLEKRNLGGRLPILHLGKDEHLDSKQPKWKSRGKLSYITNKDHQDHLGSKELKGQFPKLVCPVQDSRLHWLNSMPYKMDKPAKHQQNN